MIGAILLYLLSLFSLTFLIPTSGSSYRETIGLVCRRQFRELYGSACYWVTPEILANASFEPERIWEYWSIELVRFYLSAVWLLLVWAVVINVTLLIGRPKSKTKELGTLSNARTSGSRGDRALREHATRRDTL